MSNRAERRRQSRTHQRKPVAILDGNLAAYPTGDEYVAVPGAQLPDKVPGKHRFIAALAYVVTDEQVEQMHRRERGVGTFDGDSLVSMGVGCYDCELELSEIAIDSICRGEESCS